jgi:hypothetical protein
LAGQHPFGADVETWTPLVRHPISVMWHSSSLPQLKCSGGAMSSRPQSDGDWSATPSIKAGLFDRPLRATSCCKTLGGMPREGSSTGLRLGSALSAASALLNCADRHERSLRRVAPEAAAGMDGSASVQPLSRTPCIGRGGEAKLLIVVDTEFDIACWVSLERGESDGPDLPLIIPQGNLCSANFIAKDGEDVEGSLVLEGFGASIPFCVCAQVSGAVTFTGPSSTNFVGERGQQSALVTATDPARLAAQECAGGGDYAPLALPVGAKGAPGVTASLSISKQSPARLLVSVRRATAREAGGSSGSS